MFFKVTAHDISLALQNPGLLWHYPPIAQVFQPCSGIPFGGTKGRNHSLILETIKPGITEGSCGRGKSGYTRIHKYCTEEVVA
jgi:hypothetical protein